MSSSMPVSSKPSEFSINFIRDKSLWDFVSENKKRNKFSIDFIGLGMPFADLKGGDVYD